MPVPLRKLADAQSFSFRPLAAQRQLGRIKIRFMNAFPLAPPLTLQYLILA
ncbi:MAG: hypothetical protein WCI02_19195 [Planctomycetota bacterium]